MTQRRFIDAGTSFGSFRDRVYVRCPRCESRAVATPNKLACPSCGHAKDAANSGAGWAFRVGSGYESGLELWLQIPCRGEILWALNEDHLDFLESYISSSLRTRRYPVAHGGWSNKSLASRLPRWMTASRNREAILKALAKLRRQLPPA